MATDYDVTDIQQSVFQYPGQPSGPGYRVDFTTKPSKISGFVVIPAAMFSKDEVDQVATRAAQALEAVKAL